MHWCYNILYSIIESGIITCWLELFCFFPIWQLSLFIITNCRLFVWVVRIMAFIATFNNISDISWRPVLLVKEIGIPGENHQFV
jgi:hypothetical protein